MTDYKSTSIYVTKNEDVIIIPHGISEKWNGAIMELEIYHFLDSGYSDDLLENEVLLAFEEWNSIEPNQLLKPTAIEKYLKVKGYLKAVKDMKSINISWDIDDGYQVTPTENLGKKGFVFLENDKLIIGKVINKGDLSQAIKSAINISK